MSELSGHVRKRVHGEDERAAEKRKRKRKEKKKKSSRSDVTVIDSSATSSGSSNLTESTSQLSADTHIPFGLSYKQVRQLHPQVNATNCECVELYRRWKLPSPIVDTRSVVL